MLVGDEVGVDVASTARLLMRFVVVVDLDMVDMVLLLLQVLLLDDSGQPSSLHAVILRLLRVVKYIRTAFLNALLDREGRVHDRRDVVHRWVALSSTRRMSKRSGSGSEVLVEVGEIGLLANGHSTCMIHHASVAERDITVLVLDQPLLVVARRSIVVPVWVILCFRQLLIRFMINKRLPVYFTVMSLYRPGFNTVLR